MALIAERMAGFGWVQFGELGEYLTNKEDRRYRSKT